MGPLTQSQFITKIPRELMSCTSPDGPVSEESR